MVLPTNTCKKETSKSGLSFVTFHYHPNRLLMSAEKFFPSASLQAPGRFQVRLASKQVYTSHKPAN